MIEAIHLSRVATYGESPQTLHGLKQFNFFYGSNGSGKTTISRVVGDPAHPDHAGCRLVWKNSHPIEALVYNRDFIDANFGGDDIKGVFTVGKRSVEAVQEMDRLSKVFADQTDDLARLRRTLHGPGKNPHDGKQGELNKLGVEFLGKCWQRKLAHEVDLAGAMQGFRGDMAKFQNKVSETFGQIPKEGFVPATLEDMRARAKSVFATSKTPEKLIPIPSPQKLVELEASSVLAKVVVGKNDVDISALIERLGNSDWVKAGRPYLADSEGACPFCQQPHPPSLAASLARYFDEAFLADISAISSLETDYKLAAREWLHSIDEILNSGNTRIETESLLASRNVAAARIDANLLVLASKSREPSRSFALQPIAHTLAAAMELLSSANDAIKHHNATIENLVQEKAKLTEQFWRYLVDVDLKAEIAAHIKETAGIGKAVDNLKRQIAKAESDRKATETRIKEIEKDTTSVQPTVDLINKLLHSYGFRSFSIERAGSLDRYRLRRSDGSSARKTLSEGERTFITFLYFYFLAEGSANETGTRSDRIVVLDDPVSSLDSDVLFIVSSLIHRLMESVRTGAGPVRQMLLLTHNVHFHKEVSFNPKRNGGSLNEETFWVVRKVEDRSVVESHPENPVSSSYEMLWAEVRRSGQHAPGIQNTLRRILETYFKILGNLDFNRIAENFEPEDQPTCKSLFSWVNAGSHGALDDLHFAVDASSVERHLRVFQEVFRVSGHLPHYKMMMRQDLN